MEMKEKCENISSTALSMRELNLAETGQEIHITEYGAIVIDYGENILKNQEFLRVIYWEEFSENIQIHQHQKGEEEHARQNRTSSGKLSKKKRQQTWIRKTQDKGLRVQTLTEK